jgi:hypothetical protein
VLWKLKSFSGIGFTSSSSAIVIVTKNQNRLTRDSIRMIVCLKGQGIFADEDIEDESDDKVMDIEWE